MKISWRLWRIDKAERQRQVDKYSKGQHLSRKFHANEASNHLHNLFLQPILIEILHSDRKGKKNSWNWRIINAKVNKGVLFDKVFVCLSSRKSWSIQIRIKMEEVVETQISKNWPKISDPTSKKSYKMVSSWAELASVYVFAALPDFVDLLRFR